MDPFPTERFGALLRRFPAYARLAWRLARDRRIGGTRRAAVFGAAAYLASPVDLVPGIIPVAGQLDDAAVALMGLRYALGGLPAGERRAHLNAVGIVEGDLDRDLATVWSGAAWIARHGGRLALRGGRAAARGAWRAARSVGRRLRP